MGIEGDLKKLPGLKMLEYPHKILLLNLYRRAALNSSLKLV